MAKSSRSLPEWAKSIILLVVLCAVIGALLPALNDILYVSSEERTSRAVKKIYGTEMENIVRVLDVDVENGGDAIENDFSIINKVYLIGDDILVQATGKNGYKNGTITLWARVVLNGENRQIDKVVQESFTKQTLMGKLDSAFYENFYIDVTEAYLDGSLFAPKATAESGLVNPVSGASQSANAACNAINAIILYVGGMN